MSSEDWNPVETTAQMVQENHEQHMAAKLFLHFGNEHLFSSELSSEGQIHVVLKQKNGVMCDYKIF